MPSVLIVEDDPFESRMMEEYLSRGGHLVTHMTTAEEAVEVLGREMFDVVVTDLHLPGMSGLELLKQLAAIEAPPVIVVTGDTDVTTAVDAMRAGAADYVNKPLTMKALAHVLGRVVETTRLRRRVTQLEREVDVDPDPSVTAHSAAMTGTLDLARRCSSGSSALLLVGESGVGKEVVAAFVHRSSPRASGPFVRINVAAIPDTMIEAELFGAVRGAFTDARRDRGGFFAAAHGGTLLLDEIAELKLELQAKLLRVLETHRYYPVGARREVHADVRIIAATNRDPDLEVDSGRMRADLFYRLSSMVIRVPPLRERVEDIRGLSQGMLSRTRQATGRGPRQLTPDAIATLEGYGWPGNVRELRNVIERAAILIDGDVLDRAALDAIGVLGGRANAGLGREALVGGGVGSVAPRRSPSVVPSAYAPRALEDVAREAAEDAEGRHIRATLQHTGGNKSRAAELLGVSRSTLWKKMRGFRDPGPE